MEGTLFEDRATVYEASTQSIRSELNLVDLPPTDITTQYTSDYVKYYPVTSLKGGSPIEFGFNAEGSSYLDLNNSFLHIVARVTRQNGASTLDTDDVAPCSNFFHNMFQNVVIYCNNTLIEDTGNQYANILSM